jgi:hypothetical protein
VDQFAVEVAADAVARQLNFDIVPPIGLDATARRPADRRLI